jgi:hypothetical protein
MEDHQVFERIKRLTEEEKGLYSRGRLTRTDKARLRQMRVELDQFWDLLRQRAALRNAGKNPDDARLRPPEIVENYEQ